MSTRTHLQAERLCERLVWVRRLVQRPDSGVASFHRFIVDSARQLQNEVQVRTWKKEFLKDVLKFV